MQWQKFNFLPDDSWYYGKEIKKNMIAAISEMLHDN
jgi:hypothetical protein